MSEVSMGKERALECTSTLRCNSTHARAIIFYQLSFVVVFSPWLVFVLDLVDGQGPG
jgi:hypothetical protein